VIGRAAVLGSISGGTIQVHLPLGLLCYQGTNACERHAAGPHSRLVIFNNTGNFSYDNRNSRGGKFSDDRRERYNDMGDPFGRYAYTQWSRLASC
jgi:hypothetical protein